MCQQQQCVNLENTCVVLRPLTIKNAKIYDGSIRFMRVRNRVFRHLVAILPKR
jgi:hypothetical protein